MKRRSFLRGLGACVALPYLECLDPRPALAAASRETPLRLAFVYHPNGAIMEDWLPCGFGGEFAFGPTLQALEKVQNDVQVLTGLNHEEATAGNDGGGDHARAMATFLTGARARKTGGADIHVGVSVDQVAARHLGHRSRFESLELSCDGTRNSGSCDSGYACAYQYNFAWRDACSPMTPESNPRSVFERLFGDQNSADHAQRMQQQKSVLDFVQEEARQLGRRLGRTDRHKMDEYLDGIRSIERRIEKSERFRQSAAPEYRQPAGIPDSYREHIDMMFDLMALAFESDSTRVATFMLAHDGSNRSFPEIGVAEGHHAISHHQRNPDKIAKLALIDRFYIERFARFLQRLTETREANGASLLDNSMIVYGGGISDANRHDHHNLPVLLAGRGGGLQAGRHLQLAGRVPMSNLYVTLLQRMGIPVTEFGDSTGTVDGV